MTKVKKPKSTKFKLMGAYGAIFLMVCAFVGISYGVSAYTNTSEGQPTIINEAGGIINYNEAAPIMDEVTQAASDEMLGAMSVNSSIQPMEDNNGDVVYHLTQDFKDATTTIISIPDPFLTVTSTAGGGIVIATNGATPPLQWTGATSTVEMARLYVTDVATTSFNAYCGASNGATNPPVVYLIGSGIVATSSKATIENNVTTVMGADVTGSTTAKILLTPNNPYFTCLIVAVNSADATALSQTSRTLDGKIVIRVSRQRF